MSQLGRTGCAVVFAVVLAGAIGCQAPSTRAGREVDLAAEFGTADACLVLLELPSGQYTRFNAERCALRLPPCSTFKIPNAMIGLETGVIGGADHVLRWDGVERNRPEVNRDHDLRSAVAHSVVWYFQELAGAVGQERMREYLAKFDYGNQDISAGLTRFWLGTSLQISADEQVEFLRKLVDGRLPLAARTRDVMFDILRVTDWTDGTLRGKTGSNYGGTYGDLGWYVGWWTRGENTYIFAANARGPGFFGAKVRDVCREVLPGLVEQL